MNTRKRTWVKSAFSELDSKDTSTNLECDRKKTKLASSASKEQFPNNPQSNLFDKFAPTCIEELAVHTKKISEFEEWLEFCEKSKSKTSVCLITGPTGCGKTATVQVVAKSRKYEIHEWINPVDIENVVVLGDQENGNAYVASQLQAFKNFLFRASRYKSIITQCNKRLLLVEDFPNVLITDAEVFDTILSDYMSYGKSPLVFIVADSKSRGLNISYNLFSDGTKAKYNIQHISFNAIATTLMAKAMKRFCTILQKSLETDYKVPEQNIIDAIILTAAGDIRNAIANLHFSSINGGTCVLTKPIQQEDKKKGKKKLALKSIGRDESITMFHALGRVFNPKYNSNGTFTHCPEEIADLFIGEPARFISFIHSNYLPHFADIKSVTEVTDTLSLSDLMLNEYRDNTLVQTGLNIGIRGVMCSNKNPVGGWRPVGAPKRLQNSILSNNRDNFKVLQQFISANVFSAEYSTYTKILLNKSVNL